MRISMRAAILSLAGVFLLTSSLFAQQTRPLNSDVLRDQIRKLEAISVDGKSAAVQTTHKHALIGMYQELKASLESDLEDLRNIQAAVGTSSPDTRQEIVGQLSKLGDEKNEVTIKLQSLTGV